MKTEKKLSALFALLAALLAAAAVWLGFSARNDEARLLAVSDGARQQAEAFLEAVCRGDYAAAGSLMEGAPSLDGDRTPETALGQVLWTAFQDSLGYEFTGDWYACGTGIGRDVTITGLDIAAMTEPLKERTQQLLAQRVAEAGDLSLVYEEDNGYREDFVMGVLTDAAAELLAQEEFLTSWNVPLKLVCRENGWLVLPEAALIQALSGVPAE